MTEEILNIETSMVGDSIELYVREDLLYINIDNPWAGCTETGFGYTTSVTLNKDEAHELVKFIEERLK